MYLRSVIVRLKRLIISDAVNQNKLIKICICLPDGSLSNLYFEKETLVITLLQSLALTFQKNLEHIKVYRNKKLIRESEKISDYEYTESGCLNLVFTDFILWQGVRNKKIEQVNYYHMRKTGGTSLRRYFHDLSKSKSIGTSVIEAVPINRAEYFSDESSKLFITSLRDPLQRIKSLYLYEGRWQQAAETRKIEDAKSFIQWTVDISEKHEKDHRLWACISNYYIKSLIGYPEYGHQEIGEKEYQLACEVLSKFDIILITEWLNNEATFNFLSKKLGFYSRMPCLVYPTKSKSPEENTSKLFDKKTIQRVTEDNYWDFQLYSFAKRLSEDQVRY